MRVIYIYTQYRHNRWVICRQYTGDLSFTGYLPVVYGPLLSKCTLRPYHTQTSDTNDIFFLLASFSCILTTIAI